MIKLDIKLGDLYCYKQWHDSDYDAGGGYYEDEILIAIEEDRHIWENKDDRSKILWTIPKEVFEQSKITEEKLNKVKPFTKDNIILRLNLTPEADWGQFSYFEEFLMEQNEPTLDLVVNIMYELMKDENSDEHQMRTMLASFNGVLDKKYFKSELKDIIRKILTNEKSTSGVKDRALEILEQPELTNEKDFIKEMCNIPLKEVWLTKYQKAILEQIDI